MLFLLLSSWSNMFAYLSVTNWMSRKEYFSFHLLREKRIPLVLYFSIPKYEEGTQKLTPLKDIFTEYIECDACKSSKVTLMASL